MTNNDDRQSNQHKGDSHKSDPHNRGGFFALVFSILFCLAFFIYISFIHTGVNLKEVPAESLAESLGGNSVDGGAQGNETATPLIDIAKIAKPWVENADVAAYGKTVYKNNCAVCHGNAGRGDGPAGGALVPPPRNFVEGKWTAGGTSIALFKTVQNGLPGGSMAAFKHLPKSDRWAVIQFIRSVTQNKEKDDEAKLDAFAATAE